MSTHQQRFTSFVEKQLDVVRVPHNLTEPTVAGSSQMWFTFVGSADSTIPRADVSRTAFAREWLNEGASEAPAETHDQESESEADYAEITDRVTQTRDDRLALLALKFEGQATLEDKARIHLLTARLRRLDPRVTDVERQVTEDIVHSLEEADALLRRVRNEFGV